MLKYFKIFKQDLFQIPYDTFICMYLHILMKIQRLNSKTINAKAYLSIQFFELSKFNAEYIVLYSTF